MNSTDRIPDGWEEGTVESNGVGLHYTRTGGDEPPLVIAHGVFDDGPCRAPLARELADDYDVILYDARGHGRSDAPETGYGVEDRADDLLGLIDALELDDPVLFGHSMGGDTVTETAARRPDLPRAVVLEDPGSMLRHGDDVDREAATEGMRNRVEWWQNRTREELFEEDEEIRAHLAAGDDELAELLADARTRLSPNVTAVFDHEMVDPEERFPGIEAPTLVLRADVDGEWRERDCELAGLLPSGRVVHVDGAGHCIFRDEREVANRELDAFLDDL